MRGKKWGGLEKGKSSVTRSGYRIIISDPTRYIIQDSRDFLYPEGNCCETVMEQGGKYKIK